MGAGKAPTSNLLLPSQPPPPNPNRRATSAKFTSASTIQLNLNSCWALAVSFDPGSQAEKEASAAISRRVTEAVELLEKGRELQAQGDFNEALLYFTKVWESIVSLPGWGQRRSNCRNGRYLNMFEGYPEIHAALAAALYADKHALLLAENQFTIATTLDTHYMDLSYVKVTKHWPPRLVSSLQQFITLS